MVIQNNKTWKGTDISCDAKSNLYGNENRAYISFKLYNNNLYEKQQKIIISKENVKRKLIKLIYKIDIDIAIS